jgi:hypothetical protein
MEGSHCHQTKGANGKNPRPIMIVFCDLVGVAIAPVSKKLAVDRIKAQKFFWVLLQKREMKLTVTLCETRHQLFFTFLLLFCL